MYQNTQYYISPINRIRTGIKVDINGVATFVPLDPENADYQRIMALVEAGKLTIADPE